MPIIKSAKKKLRADKKRRLFNSKLSNMLSSSVKKARKMPSEKNIKEAISIADKSAKNNIIHENKAARIKSKLSKLQAKKADPAKNGKKNISPEKIQKK